MQKDIFSSEILLDARSLIMDAKAVTLLAHHKADGDAISSCVALQMVLNSLGKQTEVIYPTSEFDLTPYQPSNLHFGTHQQAPDLIISCDTANRDRLYMPEAFNRIPLINIDHHTSNSIDGTINLVDPQSSSTCELLYELLTSWELPITNDIANALMYGLLCDTQTFRTSNTSANTLKVASQLIEHGANLTALQAELITHTNPNVINCWGTIFKDAVFYDEQNAVVARIPSGLLKKYELDAHALTGLVNTLASITRVDITILCYDYNGGSKVSMRSKGYDVNKLANQFGGGGHVRAAGITSNLSPDEIILALIKEISAQ